MSPLQIRQLSPDHRVIAQGVAARAFFDEEFMVGMHGPDPLVRLSRSHHLYSHESWDEAAVHLGAFADDLMVGVIRASPTGLCSTCRNIDPDNPPQDPVSAKEWLFEVGVRETHLRHGEHAWISRVAVEPQVHGCGVGGALLDAAVAVLAERGRGRVFLECLSSRESYYLRHGFTRLDDVPDPFADVSYLMSRDLRPD